MFTKNFFLIQFKLVISFAQFEDSEYLIWKIVNSIGITCVCVCVARLNTTTLYTRYGEACVSNFWRKDKEKDIYVNGTCCLLLLLLLLFLVRPTIEIYASRKTERERTTKNYSIEIRGRYVYTCVAYEGGFFFLLYTPNT